MRTIDNVGYFTIKKQNQQTLGWDQSEEGSDCEGHINITTSKGKGEGSNVVIHLDSLVRQ